MKIWQLPLPISIRQTRIHMHYKRQKGPLDIHCHLSRFFLFFCFALHTSHCFVSEVKPSQLSNRPIQLGIVFNAFSSKLSYAYIDSDSLFGLWYISVHLSSRFLPFPLLSLFCFMHGGSEDRPFLGWFIWWIVDGQEISSCHEWRNPLTFPLCPASSVSLTPLYRLSSRIHDPTLADVAV